MKGSFITNYEEARRIKPPTLRSYIRDLALKGLSFTADKKYLEKPRIQFLYIHHVFSDEEKKFEVLLETLAKNHEFISYDHAVDKICSARIDKAYIAFSCDDGFKNNLRTAEILNAYNAKACFFINPGIIGETDPDKINRYCTQVLDFPPVEFLNWKEVELLQKMGHEVGSHTMRHMNIAVTPEREVKDDMDQTFRILTERCGSVKHFAYPYGRFFHFSPAGRKAVFEAGFTSCASAERGCHVNPASPMSNTELCIRRDYTVVGADIDHALYFLINNARTAKPGNNLFPDSLL
jgi:peptidoglycan/xylan/chitin deacetylase (PgdA/CDA1 family)